MAKGGVRIEIKNLEKLKKKLGGIPENLAQQMNDKFAEVANTFVNNAVDDAPVDQNVLRNAISFEQTASMEWRVVSAANYSAYVEFGTKSNFKAIPGIDSSKYQGKGKGDYYDFLNAILDWVKRKGIGMEKLQETNEARARFGQKRVTKKERLLDVATAIAFSIIKKGIHPHPFFFKQLPIAQQEVKKSLAPLVKIALSKS